MLTAELENRIKILRNTLGQEKISALLITNPKNVLYLTGKDSGSVLITKNSEELWVKDFYREIYSDFYRQNSYPLEIFHGDRDSFIRYVKRKKFKNLWIENISVESFKTLKKELKTNLRITDILREIRAVKSKYEIEQLIKSANVAKKAMRKAYDVVKEGVKETDAIAEIEAVIRKLGSEEPPFGDGALLSSGKDSANIHAIPKMKKIEKNSSVVVDLGAKINGYYSDMTRTIKVGNLNVKDEKIFEFVKDLEMIVIDKIGKGMNAKTLHKFADSEIGKMGYKFHHFLGHGVGLEVHELPNFSPDSEDVLKSGMVFTIEPGIYIPNKFGVRFEDMMLLDKNKVRILTR